MNVIKKLLDRETKLALVGLGYVGLPIAVEFSKKVDVVGFDTNTQKIEQYRKGYDPTNEIGAEAIATCSVDFTTDPGKLLESSFIIVAVPTPVSLDKTPDLSPVEGASKIIGENISKGTIVVFESTVYPGVTDKIIYLYYQDDKCVGKVKLRKNWNRYAYIEDIAVCKDFRGQGIGSALINISIEWAKHKNLHGLMLETQDNNLIACKFYHNCGFKIGSVDTMLYANFENNFEKAVFWYLRF